MFTQRHVTLVVFPVHNCFAYLSQYASCSHYNRSSLVDRSTVTHLPCIDLDPHSCSILAFLGHLHDVRFIMYHLYHFYTPHFFSILAPLNYLPCSIPDPFPFVLLAPGVSNFSRGNDTSQARLSSITFVGVPPSANLSIVTLSST